MTIRKLIFSLCACLSWVNAAAIQAQSVVKLHSGASASFRGISVVSENEVWLSGTEGTVLQTQNAGQSWAQVSVPDSEELDFRDIEVLPDGSIILMSIGHGETSKLFRSTDNGATWKIVLQNCQQEAFFDGLAFHSDGKRGALFGDPIEGVMDLYLTHDGGQSWQPVQKSQQPPMLAAEYGFAASGTGIVWNESGIWIATGGSVARIHHTANEGESWQVLSTPILAGRESAGIFSMAIQNDQFVLAGGDYLKPDEIGLNVAVSSNAAATFRVPAGNQIGHKACVRFLSASTLVCCGRTGVDLSNDLGQSWKHLTDTAYYTMDVDVASGTAFFAGPNGNTGTLKILAAVESK